MVFVCAPQPANILIDKEFNAKVADFGLSKEVDEADVEVKTRVAGSVVSPAPS